VYERLTQRGFTSVAVDDESGSRYYRGTLFGREVLLETYMAAPDQVVGYGLARVRATWAVPAGTTFDSPLARALIDSVALEAGGRLPTTEAVPRARTWQQAAVWGAPSSQLHVTHWTRWGGLSPAGYPTLAFANLAGGPLRAEWNAAAWSDESERRLAAAGHEGSLPAEELGAVGGRRASSGSRNVAPGRSARAVAPGNGPTAKCRDGTLSYSAHRQGTCSHHGGVAVWYR
jgi:hypothetical protein